MGIKFDIYKVTLDFLKGNKVLLLIVTSILGGGAVGYQLPEIFKAPDVNVTVKSPESDKRIDWCVREIKKLKRWHGGE